MNNKNYIHTLFETKNYIELYQTQASTINEMLLIREQKDLEDYLESDYFLDENVFWLYDAAVHGESLLIGGYDEDVTKEVLNFLKCNLPETIFCVVKEKLQNLYVDLGTRDNLKEKIDYCNQCLKEAGYFIQLEYEDTYCAGVYFLSVVCYDEEGD